MNAIAIALLYAQGMTATPYGPSVHEREESNTQEPCESVTNDEIVVCKKLDHPTNQRLSSEAQFSDIEGSTRAEVKIGSAKAGIRAEQGSVGGFTSNRLMMGIKIPLGRRGQQE